MTDVSFCYPTRDVNTLNNISIQVSMASRVAVIGVNGAGKSTMIKLLIGELEPNKGEGKGDITRHPNMRLAYVAQHAFHHIENHLEKSPVNYLEWRFAGGMDREGQAKNFLELTEEEEKLIGQKPGQIEMLCARRKGKKGNEYEAQFVGCQNPMEENSWMSADALLKMKWIDNADKKRPEYEVGPALQKLMMQVDERIAFEASGIATKKLTQLNLQKHLDCFNLETQFGTYSKVSALSGGQKVKVVLAACMWMEPHVTILDEPTNFLDRDSLGALPRGLVGRRRQVHRHRLRVDGRGREGAQEGREGGGQDGLALQGGQVRRLWQQDRGEGRQEEDPQVGAQEDQEARRRPAQEGPGDLDRRGGGEGGVRGSRARTRRRPFCDHRGGGRRREAARRGRRRRR